MGVADNFNANGVSRGALVRTIPKAVVIFVEYRVRCRKAGGECKQLVLATIYI